MFIQADVLLISSTQLPFPWNPSWLQIRGPRSDFLRGGVQGLISAMALPLLEENLEELRRMFLFFG